MTVKIKGEKEIAAAMRKFINAEITQLRKGVQKAGMFIMGEAQQLTPVDAGILRASAFYSTDIMMGRVRGRVGYTAEYAPWVHEMPMKLKGQPRADFGKTRDDTTFGGGTGKGFYWDSGENKFLQKAYARNTTQIINIIAEEAKF